MSRDLLNALYSNDSDKAKKIFKQEMNYKQQEVLNVKKVALAADIFNPTKTKD